MQSYYVAMGETITGRQTGNIPGLESSEQRSWQSFLDATLLVYASVNRGLVDAHHLTLNDVRILDLIARSPDGSARMGDLADELMSLPSRVTRQIHRLEKQGLVRRSSSPDDGRGVLATITDDGRSALSDAMATYGDGVRKFYLGRLSRAQVGAVGDSCRRIGQTLRADPSPARLGRV